jgi:hypothetical protein
VYVENDRFAHVRAPSCEVCFCLPTCPRFLLYPPPSPPSSPPPSHISLVRDPNNATSGPPAGIAGFQAILMSALPQIIGPRVHDDGAAQHGLLADQLDQTVLDAALGVAAVVGLEVAEIAHVAGLVGWGARRRGLAGWVER